MILDQYGKHVQRSSAAKPEVYFDAAARAIGREVEKSIGNMLNLMREMRAEALVDPRGNPAKLPRKIGSTVQVKLPVRFAQ